MELEFRYEIRLRNSTECGPVMRSRNWSFSPEVMCSELSRRGVVGLVANGLYGKSWLFAPTLSQVGLDEFNKSPGNPRELLSLSLCGLQWEEELRNSQSCILLSMYL